jgi:hypothetical protein
MSKKRYTLYLSRPLARKFDQIAKLRNGAKSALVEEALKTNLEPQQHPGVEEGLARRLNDLNKAVTAIGRDVVVAIETLGPFQHPRGRATAMGDLFSLPAAEEAQGRRRQMLRTAFGPTIAAALADPTVIEVMVNPDGKLWIERATDWETRHRRAHRQRRGGADHPAGRCPRPPRGDR